MQCKHGTSKCSSILWLDEPYRVSIQEAQASYIKEASFTVQSLLQKIKCTMWCMKTSSLKKPKSCTVTCSDVFSAKFQVTHWLSCSFRIQTLPEPKLQMSCFWEPGHPPKSAEFCAFQCLRVCYWELWELFFPGAIEWASPSAPSNFHQLLREWLKHGVICKSGMKNMPNLVSLAQSWKARLGRQTFWKDI